MNNNFELKNLDIYELYNMIPEGNKDYGISVKDGNLIYMTGFETDYIEDYISNQNIIDLLNYIWEDERDISELSNEEINILKEIGINDLNAVKYNDERVIKYALNNSILRKEFKNAQYITDGCYDIRGFIGFYWPLEDIINDIDYERCLSSADYRNISLIDNFKNRNLIYKIIKNI